MKAARDKVVPLIKTARGQLDGILKMIDEDRYCIDISNQVLAVISILGKANKEIIRAHLADASRIPSPAALPRKWKPSWMKSCPFWIRCPADHPDSTTKPNGSTGYFR